MNVIEPGCHEYSRSELDVIFGRPKELLAVLEKPVEQAVANVFAEMCGQQVDGAKRAVSEFEVPYTEWPRTLRLPQIFDTRDPTPSEIEVVAEFFARAAISWLHRQDSPARLGDDGWRLWSKSYTGPRPDIIWRVRPDFDIMRDVVPVLWEYEGKTVKDFVTGGRATPGSILLKSYWRGHLN